jgi:hypothetical protein
MSSWGSVCARTAAASDLVAACSVAGESLSEELHAEEPITDGAPDSAISRRVAIRLGLVLAGASTIAWTEPGLSTITLAHGGQLSPLCIDEDDGKDTDHGPDSRDGDDSDDSDSRDNSDECDDSDDSSHPDHHH